MLCDPGLPSVTALKDGRVVLGHFRRESNLNGITPGAATSAAAACLTVSKIPAPSFRFETRVTRVRPQPRLRHETSRMVRCRSGNLYEDMAKGDYGSRGGQKADEKGWFP